MSSAASSGPEPASAVDPAPWLVEVAVAGPLAIPDLGPAGVDDLVEWLWMRFGDEGLVGVDEGSVHVDEAVAAGLAAGPLVIDVAAAPADRDWVAAGPRRVIGLAFADEPAARAAAAVLAALAGLRVESPRPLVAAAPVPQEPVAVPGFGWVLPPGGALPVAASADTAAAPAPREAIVFIDSGLGFGTGLHPTTRLCLRAIADHVAAGGRLDRVLDCGAGSGILGIAAAVLGAAAVDAVEIDTGVHEAIRANAALNGVAPRLRIAATLAGLGTPPARGYDLVVANIVAAVLDDLAATLVELMAPGGRLVVSGLVAAETPAVAARHARLCGARGIVTADGDWRCLTFPG
jgi:ribosomal protein L11 methyltransferase